MQHRLAHSSSNNINKLAVSTNLTQPIIRPFGNSFFPFSTALWNSIPPNIQNLDSQPEFFRKTKEHFWSSILIEHNLEPDLNAITIKPLTIFDTDVSSNYIYHFNTWIKITLIITLPIA